MSGLLQHPIRVAARLFWLAGELFLAAAAFGWQVFIRPQVAPAKARALWLQQSSRRILRIFNVQLRACGEIPESGLLVCNHLSYLDVLVLSALTPAMFVAKREVRHWPVFGWFASLAGTLFVDRSRRMQVGRAATQIQGAIDSGIVVILFPEGTSSDGQTVLPFKSSLLEPATRSTSPVSASLLDYGLTDGDVGQEVCYWRDMTFFPHLVNLLSKKTIRASVRFIQVQPNGAPRKELARQLRSEILKLKAMPSPANAAVGWRSAGEGGRCAAVA